MDVYQSVRQTKMLIDPLRHLSHLLKEFTLNLHQMLVLMSTHSLFTNLTRMHWQTSLRNYVNSPIPPGPPHQILTTDIFIISNTVISIRNLSYKGF